MYLKHRRPKKTNLKLFFFSGGWHYTEGKVYWLSDFNSKFKCI